ncbi:MAG: M42 family metallopeptidase [Firmicutes bacterium]|nr:M42 family metallopeptidase [Bacillota bacterium]
MLLKRLTEASGPSGFEGEVRDLIRTEAAPYADRMYTDALGSLIVETGLDKPGPRVLVAAHMDEVALMVVGFTANGLLRFRPIGGVDLRILVAKSVRVGKAKLYGVIGAKAVHLQEAGEREKPLALEQLFIDIGAVSEAQAKEHVQAGDIAVFTTEYEEMGDGRAKAKAFDDRVGCAVLLETMRGSFDVPVVFAFTVQEEIGLRGAGPVAYRVKPDVAFVIEGTVCNDVAQAPSHAEGTRLGAGPALSVVDRKTIVGRSMLDFLLETARAGDIPVQLRRVLGGANDAGAIHLTEMGIRSGAISVPTRYIHAPSQQISLEDYANTKRLLHSVLVNIGQEGALA